jgi:hypothetical protein
MVLSRHSRMFCPECKIERPWQDIRFNGPFQCQNCGVWLCLPEDRAKRLLWVAIPIAIATIALVRPSIELAILLWGPLAILIAIGLSSALVQIRPPKLEYHMKPGSLGLRD